MLPLTSGEELHIGPSIRGRRIHYPRVECAVTVDLGMIYSWQEASASTPSISDELVEDHVMNAINRESRKHMRTLFRSDRVARFGTKASPRQESKSPMGGRPWHVPHIVV